MNIEVKTLPFPFHSQVDPNPIKYEVFCNFNHCIHFNARLTSLYAFMRCICHRDIVPCTFTIRLLFWGSPLGFCSTLVAAEQTLQAEARGRSDACPLLNSRCQVPTTRIFKPYACYNNEGREREAIMLYFKKRIQTSFQGQGIAEFEGLPEPGSCQPCLWVNQAKCPI